jgi:hypothetical protein
VSGGMVLLIDIGHAVLLEVIFLVSAIVFRRSVLHAVMNGAVSQKTLNLLSE